MTSFHHCHLHHQNPEWLDILVPDYLGCPGTLAVITSVSVVFKW